eukprot:c9157_g1_i1 orf=334-576(-)
MKVMDFSILKFLSLSHTQNKQFCLAHTYMPRKTTVKTKFSLMSVGTCLSCFIQACVFLKLLPFYTKISFPDTLWEFWNQV